MIRSVPIVIFFVLAFGFRGLAQDSVWVRIYLEDVESGEVVPNADISLALGSDLRIIHSNSRGIASTQLIRGEHYRLSVSHRLYNGYSDDLKNLGSGRDSEKDTLTIRYYLKALPVQQEAEVIVRPQGVPQIVYESQRLSVADFEIMSDGRLVLLAYPKRLKKGSELLLYDGQRVQNSFQVPGTATGLTSDYRGNAHILCEKSVYGIQLNGNKIGISSLDPAYFYEYVAPIIDTSRTKMYFSTFDKNYPAFDYYTYDQVDSAYRKIMHVEDELMMELYRSEYKWVDVRTKLWARYKELETGIDAEIWVGANYFTQSIYYKELYAPFFFRNDSIFVFDYYKDRMYTFDQFGDKLDSVSIYHHYHPKASGWKKQLIQDKGTGKIYAVFEKAGYSYIGLIDVRTGEIGEKVKLVNRYVDKIDIYNNFVYYVYRPFESAQKKYLYRERLPYDF